MRYCKCLILLICFFPAKLFAQPVSLAKTDITGLWKGTLYNDSTKQFYRYEIAISQEKGKLTGFSHTWFILDDKQYYGVKKVKIKKSDNKIIIEDAVLIANNYPVDPAKRVYQLNILELNMADSIMTLTGPFTTNRTKQYAPLTGTINLQRKNDYWQSALVPHLEELGLVKQLSFVKDDIILSRNNQSIKPTEISVAKNKNYTITKPSVKVTDNLPIQKTAIEENKTATAKIENVLQDNKQVTAKNNQPVQKIITEENKPVIAKPENISPENKSITAKNSLPKQKKPITENKPEIRKAENILPENKTVTTKDNQLIQKPVEKKSTIVTETIIAKEKDKEKPVETVVKKLPEIPAINPPITITKNNEPAAELKARKTLLQQTVYFKSDSLQLSLYDNGEVDGDTVSVLMNGTVIMPMVGLSTNAVRKTIFINDNTDSVQLVMYAENLGSIPPNTGLLVVRDGKDIYEIRFSGDFQKNAAIIFRRKKK